MKSKLSLFIIMVISLVGILFSGYLSYGELFKKTCYLGECTSVAGVPACVYGLVMYLIIFIISILGLSSKNN
jgi:hypothetical protein